MGAVLPWETLTGRTELNRVHIHCNAVKWLEGLLPLGSVFILLLPLFLFSSPPLLLPFPPSPPHPTPPFFPFFLSKAPPQSLESSNLERLGAPRRDGRGWGQGGEDGGCPAGLSQRPGAPQRPPSWLALRSAAQEKKKKQKTRRAQMERAERALQRQSAPRKQMLLLQQARRLAGSFSNPLRCAQSARWGCHGVRLQLKALAPLWG